MGVSSKLLFVALLQACNVLAGDKDWESPVYQSLYQYPLPIPPIKTPISSYTPPDGGPTIDYYEVDIKPFQAQVYPNLKSTRLVGYDGMSPGPTFMFNRGREAVVRFMNHADRPNSVHLHGSYSRAPFDGWAEDLTPIGSYKDYYWPNAQSARTLWYHDHQIDHTAENANAGQAGFAIMHDPEELAVPGLPQGNFDIPLGLTSKRYNRDGSLWSPDQNGEQDSLWGDIIQVNGQPWPYMKVQPRKYRFRFLNAALSRSFQLYFENAKGVKQSFQVVGSDAGLSTKPVTTSQLDISMAERWEVVIDFSQYKGQNITVRNKRDVGQDEDFNSTDKVMRFIVENTLTDTSDSKGMLPLPSTLRNVKFPPAKAGVDRKFQFERHNGKWAINQGFWSDSPGGLVLAKPERGAVEVWEFENGSGGWTHPIHIHLVDFQIISRTGGERTSVLPYEATSLKDVVWLNRGETVRVIARYAPWDGLYMFHCHNLIHEDHEMMAALNVTALKDLGYDEKTSFIDPMEPRYRARPISAADSTPEAIQAKLKFFSELEAYSHADEIEERLEGYWQTHKPGDDSAPNTSRASTAATTSETTPPVDAPGTTDATTEATTPATTAATPALTTPTTLATTRASTAQTTAKTTVQTTAKTTARTTAKSSTSTKKTSTSTTRQRRRARATLMP